MTTRPDLCELPGDPAEVAGDDAAAVPRPPSDLLQSVSRAFAVLEAVGTTGGVLSAKAIARRTGLNLSTTYHLVRTLCWEGYLVRLPSGDLTLGVSIAHRYQDLVAALRAPAPMRQVLQHLTTQTGLTGYLARLVDGRVAVTDAARAPGSAWIDELAPGFGEAAATTPLGQVLQAGPSMVIEDGRLRPDASCAAVLVRRPAARWAVGLTGPLGSFAGAAPAIRALIRAGERLAALES